MNQLIYKIVSIQPISGLFRFRSFLRSFFFIQSYLDMYLQMTAITHFVKVYVRSAKIGTTTLSLIEIREDRERKNRM